MGIAAGIVASLASAKLLQKVVFGVNAWDPLMLAAVAVSLALVAFFATLVPAYRASRVDPLTVLRGTQRGTSGKGAERELFDSHYSLMRVDDPPLERPD